MKLKWGNHKLPDDIAIFNMGTALDCPSKQLGLCTTINQGIRCYAEKAEIQYKDHVLDYRRAQAHEWNTSSSSDIISRIIQRIQARRKPTRYLRFNESGDFGSQVDVEKLSDIARSLEAIAGLITYGYTARSDLDFSGSGFLVKGSGWNSEVLNGTTTVITKDQEVPEGYIECPGSCKTCHICKVNNKINVAFRAH